MGSKLNGAGSPAPRDRRLPPFSAYQVNSKSVGICAILAVAARAAW